MRDTEQSFTFVAPSTEPHTIVQTQHGMRFPDGNIIWETLNVGGGRHVNFASLAKPGPGTNGRYWDTYLNERAAYANVDPAAYAAQHQIVKRTLIIATTGVEDVTAPAEEEKEFDL